LPRSSRVSEERIAKLNELKEAIQAGTYVVPSRELATEFARTYIAGTRKRRPVEASKQLTRVGLLRRIGSSARDVPAEVVAIEEIQTP
jgi:hypothetical protein